MADLAEQISKARSQGHSDSDILNYLRSTGVDMGEKIDRALAGGHNAADILQFLGTPAPMPRLKEIREGKLDPSPITPSITEGTAAFQKPVSIMPGTSDKGANIETGTGADIATLPLRFYSSAAEQAGRGGVTMTHPKSASDFAHGLNETVLGTAKLATPFAARAMLSNIPQTLYRGALGGGVGFGVEKTGEALGIPQGFNELGNTLTGGLAAMFAGTPTMPRFVKGGLQPIQDIWSIIKNNPELAGRVAVENAPVVGPWYRRFTAKTKPTEPKPVTPKPQEPFKINPAVARKMSFTPSTETSGMPRSTGATAKGEPAYGPDVQLSPNAPAPDVEVPEVPFTPFTTSATTARRMGGTSQSSASDTGMRRSSSPTTARTPAYGSDVSLRPGAGEVQAEQPTIPGAKFEVKPGLKSRMKARSGGAGGGTGMPRSTGGRNISRRMPPKPTMTSPEEGGVPPEEGSIVLNPDMAKAFVAEQAKAAAARTAAEGRTPAAASTSGEGSKLSEASTRVAQHFQDQAATKNQAIRDYALRKQPDMTKAKWRGLSDQEKVDYIKGAGFKKPVEGHKVSRNLATVSADVEALLPD